MKRSRKKYDFFISHSSEDKEWTRRFANSLKHQGVTVWLPEEQVDAGADLSEQIVRGVRESESFVSLVGPGSPDSSWALFELGTALGLAKKVVLIVPKEMEIELLPLQLSEGIVVEKLTPAKTAREVVRTQIAEGSFSE